MNKRRILSFTMALLLVGITLNMAWAYGGGSNSINASTTLSSYSVILTQGDGSGKIDISYDVYSKGIASFVGISNLKIYKSNGTLVANITGTTSNGLLAENDYVCYDTYTYSGTAGTTYYAVATVYAKIGNVSDSKTVVTGFVTAPTGS